MKRIFNSLSKKGSQKRQKSLPKKAPSDNKQQRLNSIIATLIDWRYNSSDIDVQHTLTTLAQLLVWAQKMNTKLFWQIDQMNLFQDLYLSLFEKNKLAVLQSLILIITNIKTDYWIEKVIASPSINKVLQSEYNQQESSYLINLLRSISQRINKGNSAILINQNRSFFLQRCARYVDDQDDMIRTSSLNIIMNIMNLNSPPLENIFDCMPFLKFYFDICQRFIKKLLHFDTNIIAGTLSVYQLNRQLAQLDDTLILLDDLSQSPCKTAQITISRVFYHDVVLTYIIRALSAQGHPQLSMKVAMFCLIKTIPILIKMNFHNQVLELLFSINQGNVPCFYSNDTPRNKKYEIFLSIFQKKDPIVEPLSVRSVRQNILILLTCKDDNLLYLFTYLLIEVIKSKQFDKETLQNCGLYFQQSNKQTQKTKTQLLKIFMHQFTPPFRVLTIKNMAVLIVKLCQNIEKNTFLMNKNQILIFETIYRNSIKQVQKTLDGISIKKAIQYFEHDSKFIEIKGMEIKQKIGKEAFMSPGQENTHLQFYERCPRTTQQCIRLDLFIFGMLRKIRYIIFPSKKITAEQSVFSRIYQERISVQDGFKPGQLCKQQDKTLKCKMLSKSIWIDCAILDDLQNLIIVANEYVAARVMINLKFKYLKIQPSQTNNNASNITIKVKNYNNSTHDFVPNDDIQIKGQTMIMNQWVLAELQNRCKETKENQIKFIKKYLTMSLDDSILIDQK